MTAVDTLKLKDGLRSYPHTTIKGLCLLPVIKGLFSKQLEQFEQLEAQFGSWIILKIPGKTTHLVFHPSAAIDILHHQADKFMKSANYEVFAPLLGLGLVTSDGELWHKQRKIIAPFFTMKQYKEYAANFNSHCNRLLEDLKASENTSFDIAPYLMRTTFEILGDVLFGLDFRQYSSSIALEFPKIANYYMKRVYIKVPACLPLPGHRQAQRALKELEILVSRLLDQKACQGGTRVSFIATLKEAQKDHSHLTSRLIRDEVMTMMLAGHETTSNTLAFALYLLSLSPAWQEAGYREAKSIGEELDFDKLKGLDIIRRIIMETLRLYPTAYLVSRAPKEDMIYEGIPMNHKHVLMIPIWNIHRHTEYWEKPLEFNPDRFQKDRFGILQKKAYMPFGAGPRRCIGSEFGMLEATAILLKLLLSYQFYPVAGFKPELETAITLRPARGLWIAIKRR